MIDARDARHARIVGGERGDPVTGMGRQLRARIMSPFVGQQLTFIVNRERQADLQRLSRTRRKRHHPAGHRHRVSARSSG